MYKRQSQLSALETKFAHYLSAAEASSQNIRLRCFTFAGAISYELYLIHGYILPHMSGINGAILFLVFSVGMSMGYHFILEKGKVIWNSILRL